MTPKALYKTFIIEQFLKNQEQRIYKEFVELVLKKSNYCQQVIRVIVRGVSQ